MGSYLKQIGRRKLLTREQEVELSQKIEGTLHGPDGSLTAVNVRDQKRAKDLMIESNLRLVVSIAKGQQNRGCDLEDLIAEGNIGLMRAVDRFDWRRGFRFSTYASWWIRQAVGRHVANQGKGIRMSGRACSIMADAHAARAEFIELNGQEPTCLELADVMGVTEATMQASLSGLPRLVSLDEPIGSVDQQRSVKDTIVDDETISPFDALDHAELVTMVSQVLDALSDRDQNILRMRFGIYEDPTDHIRFPITQQEMDEIHKAQ